MTKTVKVRIAVAVDTQGDWAASGDSGGDDEERAREIVAKLPARIHAEFSPTDEAFHAGNIAEALAAVRAEARAGYDALVTALETLLLDVQDYEVWQRPCLAVDNAHAALAQVKEPDDGR